MTVLARLLRFFRWPGPASTVHRWVPLAHDELSCRCCGSPETYRLHTARKATAAA